MDTYLDCVWCNSKCRSLEVIGDGLYGKVFCCNKCQDSYYEANKMKTTQSVKEFHQLGEFLDHEDTPFTDPDTGKGITMEEYEEYYIRPDARDVPVMMMSGVNGRNPPPSPPKQKKDTINMKPRMLHYTNGRTIHRDDEYDEEDDDEVITPVHGKNRMKMLHPSNGRKSYQNDDHTTNIDDL